MTMSKKYYDDFSRLPISKMAESITDMTYSYERTEVPKAHYQKLLNAELLELIAQDSTMEVLLLNAVLTQLKSLEKESPKLFMKALICLNENINVDKMNQRTFESLEQTYIEHQKTKPIINQDISQSYKDNYENHPHELETPNTDLLS